MLHGHSSKYPECCGFVTFGSASEEQSAKIVECTKQNTPQGPNNIYLWENLLELKVVRLLKKEGHVFGK